MNKVFTLILIPLFFIPSTVQACPMITPQVQEEDVIHAPDHMLAFKGKIISTDHHGNPNSTRYRGYNLRLKVIKLYKGKITKGQTITVNYGHCHGLPSKKNDEIYVLALPKKTWWRWIKKTWYAPQFWGRK
jgi:hypothetical protein